MDNKTLRRGSTDRAINTVLDVGLALVILSAAIALLATVPFGTESDSERIEADRTADVLAGSTVNVSYSVEPTVARAATALETNPTVTNEAQLRRQSHGTIASQLADAAVANLRVDTAKTARLTPTGAIYENALDTRLRTRLQGSNYRTNVTAVWEPYPGASMRGQATAGPVPPAGTSVNAATLDVSSTIAGTERSARTVAEETDSFSAVAAVVAEAVIEGYTAGEQPAGPATSQHSGITENERSTVRSQRALQRTGIDRTLTRYRYHRLAMAIPDADPEKRAFVEALTQRKADTDAANEYLVASLTETLRRELAAAFDSPESAAAALSTGSVTITIRTWER